MLALWLDLMILTVFCNLNDSMRLRIYFITTLRMMLGCPPAQLTNLYTGTLCKAKSIVSVTSPVRSIGQEVTNKVARYSSDLHFSLQVSYFQKISRSQITYWKIFGLAGPMEAPSTILWKPSHFWFSVLLRQLSNYSIACHGDVKLLSMWKLVRPNKTSHITAHKLTLRKSIRWWRTQFWIPLCYGQSWLSGNNMKENHKFTPLDLCLSGLFLYWGEGMSFWVTVLRHLILWYDIGRTAPSSGFWMILMGIGSLKQTLGCLT